MRIHADPDSQHWLHVSAHTDQRKPIVLHLVSCQTKYTSWFLLPLTSTSMCALWHGNTLPTSPPLLSLNFMIAPNCRGWLLSSLTSDPSHPHPHPPGGGGGVFTHSHIPVHPNSLSSLSTQPSSYLWSSLCSPCPCCSPCVPRFSVEIPWGGSSLHWNGKCSDLQTDSAVRAGKRKKITFLQQVFICLRPKTPYPPLTHCVSVFTVKKG